MLIVGSSAPWKRLEALPELRRSIYYRSLSKMKPAQRAKAIHNVLRSIGARYCTAKPTDCGKTKALLKNFNTLSNFPGGPKAFFRTIASLECEIDRVHFLMRNFTYIKSKSARDFLIDVGLAKNALALDVRILNILQKAGIKCSQKSVSTPKKYDQLEAQLLKEICTPLKISGAAFDRMLYQNYEKIMTG